jgi:putative lipoprotein
MRTCHDRLKLAATVALLALQAALPRTAAADIGDISVGGVWVGRLTQGAAGLTLEGRVRQINQQITEVLSLRALRGSQVTVEVQPARAAAAITVADIVVVTLTPRDAAGTGVPAYEVANQWAARLAAGLRRALSGTMVIARMYAPPIPPPPPEDKPRVADITWYWQGARTADGSQLVPDDPRRYSLRFSKDRKVAVRADCNRAAGTYDRRGQVLTVSIEAVTRAACRPGSLGRQYLAHLNAVGRAVRRGDRLTLGLNHGRGVMAFSSVLREARVTGIVTHRLRMALPADAIVTVQLREVSMAEAPAILLGQQTLVAGGRQVPFAFEIKYDPRRVTPNAILVVRAMITVGGRLLLATTAVHRVITGGYPSEGIEAVLEPVM